MKKKLASLYCFLLFFSGMIAQQNCEYFTASFDFLYDEEDSSRLQSVTNLRVYDTTFNQLSVRLPCLRKLELEGWNFNDFRLTSHQLPNLRYLDVGLSYLSSEALTNIGKIHSLDTIMYLAVDPIALDTVLMFLANTQSGYVMWGTYDDGNTVDLKFSIPEPEISPTLKKLVIQNVRGSGDDLLTYLRKVNYDEKLYFSSCTSHLFDLNKILSGPASQITILHSEIDTLNFITSPISGLKKLTIKYSTIGYCDSLVNMPSLEELALFFIENEEEFRWKLDDFQHLKRFSLIGSKEDFGGNPDDFFNLFRDTSKTQLLPKLEHLRLGDISTEIGDFNIVSFLQKMPSLRSLDLVGNNYSYDDILKLPHIKELVINEKEIPFLNHALYNASDSIVLDTLTIAYWGSDDWAKELLLSCSAIRNKVKKVEFKSAWYRNFGAFD